MKDYCIWIVSPNGYLHSHAFDEFALSLRCAFQKLGYEVPIIRDTNAITNHPIVLGCNLIPSLPHVKLPLGTIMFNLEQIQPGSPWMTQDYINLLRSYEVWDYSLKNIYKLQQVGIKKIKFCGIGYVPELTKIKHTKEDIDILLYGSLNHRRLKILKKLQDMNFRVKAFFGIYGKQRDQYISRSRIILNIHYYEAKVFEIIRVSYLLANKKFVISEVGDELTIEKPFSKGLIFVPYIKLVDECVNYLKNDTLRAEIAEKGFYQMQSLSQVDFLRQALDM